MKQTSASPNDKPTVAVKFYSVEIAPLPAGNLQVSVETTTASDKEFPLLSRESVSMFAANVDEVLAIIAAHLRGASAAPIAEAISSDEGSPVVISSASQPSNGPNPLGPGKLGPQNYTHNRRLKPISPFLIDNI